MSKSVKPVTITYKPRRRAHVRRGMERLHAEIERAKKRSKP